MMTTGSLHFSLIEAVGVLHIFGHPKEETSCTVMGCTILESNLFGLEQSLPDLFSSLAESKSVVRLIEGLIGRWIGDNAVHTYYVHGQVLESDTLTGVVPVWYFVNSAAIPCNGSLSLAVR